MGYWHPREGQVLAAYDVRKVAIRARRRFTVSQYTFLHWFQLHISLTMNKYTNLHSRRSAAGDPDDSHLNERTKDRSEPQICYDIYLAPCYPCKTSPRSSIITVKRAVPKSDPKADLTSPGAGAEACLQRAGENLSECNLSFLGLEVLQPVSMR